MYLSEDSLVFLFLAFIIQSLIQAFIYATAVGGIPVLYQTLF